MLVLEADVDQGFRQGDALALASAECSDRLMQLVDVEFAQDLFHFRIEIPCAYLVHFNNGPAKCFSVIPLTHILIIADGIHHRVIMAEDIIQDGVVFHELGFLLEESDVHVLVPPDLSAVRRIHACQYPHKC
jgi:hypothetical protein